MNVTVTTDGRLAATVAGAVEEMNEEVEVTVTGLEEGDVKNGTEMEAAANVTAGEIEKFPSNEGETEEGSEGATDPGPLGETATVTAGETVTAAEAAATVTEALILTTSL